MRRLGGITKSMDMNLNMLCVMVKDKDAWSAMFMGSQRVGHEQTEVKEQLNEQ